MEERKCSYVKYVTKVLFISLVCLRFACDLLVCYRFLVNCHRRVIGDIIGNSNGMDSSFVTLMKIVLVLLDSIVPLG